ncbi:MAG TPA: hypothetical protein PKY56_01305 [Candidatus Kapabacteria bacterium]|nr:hypothetical protein [Candidatus Kapabacteria bacterium]HPO62842.1 hypothetical protein [Candidatus Kapabacteria bacterium]
MKNLIFITMLIFLAVSVTYSQIPNTISWQGILQDSEGNNLTGNHNLTVKLYEIATGGTALWTETHNDLNIVDGLVNLTLGSVTPLNLSFDSQYWLEISVGEGTPLPRIILNSVPYSLYSKKSSGIIENDSIVLKDSLGVTRMVFNPNTGTFKMMNNDTTWYEMNVNSPLSSRIQNSNGTQTISWDGVESTYNSDGVLLYEKIKENYDDEDGNNVNNETTIYYDENENVTLENIEIQYFDGVSTVTEETRRFYDSEGNISIEYNFNKSENIETGESDEVRDRIEYDSQGNIVKETENTYIDGELFKQTNYSNGVITSEKEFYEDRTDNVIYNPNGTINRKVSNYQDQLKNEIISGNYYTMQYQTPYNWVYQNSGTNSSFFIQNGNDDSYRIGIQGSNPTNPSLSFTPDGTGGYTTFSGSAVFQNNITTSSDVYANSAYFNGNLNVNGTKNFRIDHPDDPENKFLVHAAIESDQVLNQYSGNVVTNSEGMAIVKLPDYVEKINKNFRYQLTVIGDFAQAIILKKIANNQFTIRTDKPNIEVSWEITAERNDKYLREHPFNAVQEKNSVK